MPIPWLEIPSPTLGNTKKTYDECYGQTTAQRIKKKIYSILEHRQENLDVTSYIKTKPTYSYSNKVLKPTRCNQDEIRALKYLEPRNDENLPEQQICYQEPQITAYLELSEDKLSKYSSREDTTQTHIFTLTNYFKGDCSSDGCSKRLAEIITWDLIRLLDYFHSSTALHLNEFKDYPALRVDKLSICYSREDTTQTHICTQINNYEGDCSADGCLKSLAEIITWDLIRLLDYFHSSTTLPLNGFKAYPELRVDQLSICYSRDDITQTHIFILVDNYKGDCSSDVCLKRLAEIIHSHLIRLLNQPNRSISLPFNGFRDIDNSLTNPVCADIPHVIEKIKSGRNIKDIDDSLADPGADNSPHGKEETSDERNKKDIDDNLKVPVADDPPHGKEETSDERNKKDRCFVRLIGVIYLLFNVLNYQKTLFGKCTKSCKGVQNNKGIAVICFSLMIGFGGGATSSNGVCSVSSHLEGIPSESLEVGKGMKLICRHTCSKGTPRWDQDKPIGRELTFNGNVRTPNKQNIELEIIENEYNIIFRNATFADINSTYTCHYGFSSTHINPIDFYKVLPTDKSTSKQSVYKNNVLNGTLEFEEVYPLPECVSYCGDKRQKKIPLCKTCMIWKRNFYKVKFIFNIVLNNKICREENVSVRCAVGRNHYTYDFSILTKKNKNNKETTRIVIGIIIGVIFLVGLFVLGILCKRGAFSRCWRDRNVETLGNQYYQPERSPDHGNNSQNKRQENFSLIEETSTNLLDTNDSNGQISEQSDSKENVSLNQEEALNLSATNDSI